jgi:hypothetical protein
MAGRRGATPHLATAGYLLHVAKDWTVGCFATAQSSDFALVSHRFELGETGVQRHALPIGSLEAASPLEAVGHLPDATAWSHSASVTLLVDHAAGTTAIEQEMVEVLAVEDETVLAQAAAVIRIPGVGVCLGPFGAP